MFHEEFLYNSQSSGYKFINQYFPYSSLHFTYRPFYDIRIIVKIVLSKHSYIYWQLSMYLNKQFGYFIISYRQQMDK